MSDEESVRDFPDEDQRFAFCQSRWEDRMEESVKLNEVYGPGFAFSEAIVDRDQRIIRNVSLLGRSSKNNRTYSNRALTEAADLHKGAGVYLDHPTRSEERETGGVRSFRDLAGRVITASVRNDRVKGDIQVLEGIEGDKILAVAEQMPGVAGFSHRATGEVKAGDDGDVVESISAVHGADIVTDPATVSGLFESLRTAEADVKISEMTLEQLRSERPDLVEAVEAEATESQTVEDLKEQNQKLQKRNDELSVKLQAQERSSMIAEKLEEANLPEFVVTDVFREQLEDAKDEDALDRLIAERQELAKGMKSGGPKSTARDFDEKARDQDGGPKEVNEEAIAEAYDSLFL